MAVVKTSGIAITEISGKLAGTVFARNGAGLSTRNRVKGTNPRTNLQTTQRAKFSSNAGGWRGLTDAERKSWNLAAASGEWPYKNRLGETQQPSGSQLYNRLNDTITSVGGAVITTPPLKVSFTAITLGALTSASGTPSLSLAFTGVLGSDEGLVITATYGLSPGVSRPSRFNKVAYYTSTTPANLLTGYQAVYGNPIEGTRIFVRAEIVNELTGQRELVGQVSAIVAA
jgi:hypothetical protein